MFADEGAFRPDQPPAAAPGPNRHQARGRLPAHSRIHRSVCSGLRRMGLASIGSCRIHMCSGLPQCPRAEICQARHPLGSRWCPLIAATLRFPTDRTAVRVVIFARALPKENLWDEIREKIFKNYALKSIDAVRAKSSNKPSSMFLEVPKNCKIHHVLSLRRKSFDLKRLYLCSGPSVLPPICAGLISFI